MAEKKGQVPLHNAIAFKDNDDSIEITFGTVDFNNSPQNVTNAVDITIQPSMLKGIVNVLIKYGIKYQEKHNCDIGFELPKE